ncbi:hypothetical protein [uncultured Methylobacterium sp.]|uniref:hypothetical protein n=1 Tax=uncultured Methylobacterium sp. TaxID=157278 RepID=UPI0035C9D508
MNLLKITGGPQSGKTRTLISLARVAERSDVVVYVSPWMRRDVHGLLYSVGMPLVVKMISARTGLEGFRGLRPAMVLIDDINALSCSEQHRLLKACEIVGARHVVTAGL